MKVTKLLRFRVWVLCALVILTGCAQPPVRVVEVAKPYYIIPEPVYCPTVEPVPPDLEDYAPVILPALSQLGVTADTLPEQYQYLAPHLGRTWVALGNDGDWQAVDGNDKQKLALVDGIWAVVEGKDKCIALYNEKLKRMQPPEVRTAGKSGEAPSEPQADGEGGKWWQFWK